ncbi:MAG: hypothetical protein EXX96DRAFT_351903 [Benjaminiella poitrasii]|nr:MAG: hypothetical protein EXX96DRAFT_351903 [Benjaminiella poitrasii]
MMKFFNITVFLIFVLNVCTLVNCDTDNKTENSIPTKLIVSTKAFIVLKRIDLKDRLLLRSDNIPSNEDHQLLLYNDTCAQEQIQKYREYVITNEGYRLLLDYFKENSNKLRSKMKAIHNIFSRANTSARKSESKKKYDNNQQKLEAKLQNLFRNVEEIRNYIKPMEDLTNDELIEVFYNLLTEKAYSIKFIISSAYSYVFDALVVLAEQLVIYIVLKYLLSRFLNRIFSLVKSL